MFDFKNNWLQHWHRAKASGMPEPVVVLLEKGSPCYGDVLQAAQLEDSEARLQVIELPSEKAISLLRAHANVGGKCIADFLDKMPVKGVFPVFVGLGEFDVATGTIVGPDDHPTCFRMPYNFVPSFYPCPDMPAEGDGPFLMKVSLDNGLYVPICGKTVEDMRLAADVVYLVGIAMNNSGRSTPVRSMRRFLKKFYWEKPEVVAECIRGLRKAGDKYDKIILDALWRDQSMRDLAKRVQSELTGDSSE